MSAPSPGIILEVRGLDKAFGATRALDSASLQIREDEIHALVGENGAGKSTLIKVLAGALRADAGDITWLGRRWFPPTPAAARDMGIATCHQELSIAPHLSVTENILLGQEISTAGWVCRRESRRHVIRILETLDQAHIPVDAPAGSLPISSQQLVEIARAIASNARLIILDEPTSSLTQSDAQSLFALIRRLRERGTSFLYVSHFLEEIMQLCDHYTVMSDGRTVGSGRVAGTTIDGLISMMVGRKITDLYPQTPHKQGEPLLTLSGLAGAGGKPGRTDFSVRRGEILGIGGLVGSGRSELLRAIYGLRRAQRGRVTISKYPDENMAAKSVAHRLRRGLGFASEDRKTEGLSPRQSLAENIGLSALQRAARGGWLRPRILRALAREAADSLSAVYRDIGQPVMDLSGGNQQKIALARLLFSQSDVLLLDEPTRGIDVGSKTVIYQWLGAEAARGKAIMLTSSYLPELLGMCDRIGMMCRGRLVALGPRTAWTEEKMLLAATTGANPVGDNT
ncbi:MAG: sugar ABC transporter ATP-binding protein [Candidatus Sumerlaeota bacterium]|nr:sugar ABC transporter ATP-binding protein [Candidatus Sumerlaeota bacterium]